ncbi:MAG: LTA synthase family protein [Vulcanimicrobiota bacterium]
MAYLLPVLAYQGLTRHFLNLLLLVPVVAVICFFRKRTWLALLFSLSVSTLCLLHEVSNRTLSDILSLLTIEQIVVVNQIKSSFFSSLWARDILYFIDIPIWLCWLRYPPAGKVGKNIVAASFLLGLAAQGVFWMSLSVADKERLFFRHKNIGLMLAGGVVEYHLIDLREFLEEFLEHSRSKPIPREWVEQNLTELKKSWSDGPYKGRWKGKNLWFVQLESLQWFALDAQVDGQPVMPFLHDLANRSLRFDRCYDQTATGVSLDCDFMVNNSLVPNVGRPTFYRYRDTDFYSLTHVLNDLGYLTICTHDENPAFYNLPVITLKFGYKVRRFVGETPPPPKPDELIGPLGMRDYSLLYRVLKGLEPLKVPFLAHIVCPMGHAPYQELRPDQRLLRLPPRLQGTMMGDYLQTCRFRDEELKHFFQEYLASPLAKNTAICVYGDHTSHMSRQETSRFFGRTLSPLEQAEQQRILIFFYDGQSQGRIEKPCGLIDFAPTIAYLLGETSLTPVWLGRNVFSTEPHLTVCRRHGFVATEDGLKELSESHEGLPPLSPSQKEEVQRQILFSERLCLQNQIRKFANWSPARPSRN